jgi:hypothetical protein
MTSRDTHDILAYETELLIEDKHQQQLEHLNIVLCEIRKQVVDHYAQIEVPIPSYLQHMLKI